MHHRFPLWGGSLIFLPPPLSIRDPLKSSGAQTALVMWRYLMTRTLKANNSVSSRISQFTKLITKSGISPLESVTPATMNSRRLPMKPNKKPRRRGTPSLQQKCNAKADAGYSTSDWRRMDSVTTAAWSTNLSKQRFNAGMVPSHSSLMMSLVSHWLVTKATLGSLSSSLSSKS